jgi:hypothetical protein
MEYCSGGSAAAAVRTLQNQGAVGLDIDAVVEIGIAISEGLLAAHRHGLVHGDVKPANILFGAYSPKLTDFGIAAFTQDQSDGAPAGVSYQYTAPEVLRWEPATAASDLYSLGATLYALLAGGVPFPAADTEQVVGRVQHEAPPPLMRPDVPAELVQLVDELMQKAPAKRPASAADVRDRLSRLRGAGSGEMTVDLSSLPALVPARGGWTTGWKLVVVIVAVVALIALLARWSTGAAPAPTDREIAAFEVPVAAPGAPDGDRSAPPLAPRDVEITADGRARAVVSWRPRPGALGYVIARADFAGAVDGASPERLGFGYVGRDGRVVAAGRPLLRLPPGAHRTRLTVAPSDFTCVRVVALVPGALVASPRQSCVPTAPPVPVRKPRVDVDGARAIVSWVPRGVVSGYAVLELVDEDGERVVEQVAVEAGVRSATLPAHAGAGFVVVALNAVNAADYPVVGPVAGRQAWSEAATPP